MAAAHYKLDSLTAILDRNGLMTNGPTDLRYSSSPIDEKWAAFGWHVQDIDGHDMGAILEALDKADEIRGQPKIIIARTIKARGIPFAEGRPEYHNGIMTADQYACLLYTSLEGTENRIAVERRNFNSAVQAYDAAIRRFPGVLLAGAFGFTARPYFAASPGAETAPKVDFGG